MTEFDRADFAGFWTRFIAFVIDVVVVSFIVFPFALVVGLVSPSYILIEVPFDLFTTTTTVSEINFDGTSIEKDEVLGLWTNYYEVTESKSDNGKTSRSRSLVEPITYRSITRTTSSDIEFYVIFIYWILLEASVWQASLGKKIMGLEVVTQDGGRPNIFQCTARNLLKILSALILFIGFMMAGWTDKKQGLHDKMSGLFIVKRTHGKSIQKDDGEAGTSC